MHRVIEQFRAIGTLDELAEIHHPNFVGDMLHHRKIVRDEQVGKVHLILNFAQKVQNLRLNRHVQR